MELIDPHPNQEHNEQLLYTGGVASGKYWIHRNSPARMILNDSFRWLLPDL
ncbi:MAG: hypothetical protein HC925_09590 [Coleofasciculaceae cyanobacterium SM2_3_26]|nr:hypothetical protein [Coleofasciculaceae cyanobacterium SM2_3_26]